ncbi:MAG: MBOAT family protein, partial [Planctomycetota bacterium]|nr:MBOAT family protein [Planctomycetota bacterium]
MNFHSVTFGVFLSVVFSLFWLTYRHRNLRSAIMLVASYAFYGAFNPLFLGLIGFSTLLDHKCGLVIHRSESERTRRLALLASLVMNLGLLGFFKYYDFGVENLQRLFASMGLSFPLETLGIVVPVGISFYTFQTLSYTIDLYRRRMEPARNLLDFALFVAFFP